MNRKLVNGLLLLTLVTGGCGLFTSCKDTDEDYRNEILKNQDDLLKIYKDIYDKAQGLDKEVQDMINKNLFETDADGNLLKDANGNPIPKYASGEKFEDLYKALFGKTGSIENPGADGLIAKLQNKDPELDKLLNQLSAQLKDYEANLTARLDKLITNIEIHQTWNPIFGSFNFPVGLSSSINANYYGVSLSNSVDFPLTLTNDVDGSKSSAIYRLGEDAINNLRDNLNGSPLTIASDEVYFSDEDNNLGQIYLTVNPNQADLSTVKWTLVNSQNEEVEGLAITPKTTDETLTFGYHGTSTRAESSDWGFYRAEVKTTNPEALKIEINDNLKSTMKDALKSPSKSDLATLAKLLYDEMQKGLTAYAVKATWSVPEQTTTVKLDDKGNVVKDENGNAVTETTTKDNAKTYSVISKYDIAAATFKPLGYGSFNTNLYDKFHFPTYNGTLKDAIDKVFDSFDINFKLDLSGVSALDPKDFKIDLSSSKVSFEGAEIVIDLGGQPISFGTQTGTIDNEAKLTLTYDANTGTVSNPNAGALKNLLDKIANQINDMLDNDSIEKPGIQQKINELLQEKVVGQVNDMVATINKMLIGDGTPNSGMNAQINKNIQDILSNIKSNILGKIGKAESLLEKYNKIATKLNNILKDPNHYLQVMAAYEDANKDVHTLSTSVYMPSKFNKAALEIYVTSYTSEIIAPSYKKYVAIANVYDKNTLKPLNDWAKVNEANKCGVGETLNTIFPGHNQIVGIDGSKLDSQYIYELVYTSLDYNGKTSSQLYYFTVE